MIRVSFDNKLYVSYAFLKEHGVTEKSISNWSYRKSCNKVYFDNSPFIEYSTIPNPTLKKLPTEGKIRSLLQHQQQSDSQTYFTNLLKTAFEKEFLKYRYEYNNDPRLTADQIIQCARLRAVWEKILKQRTKRGVNILLHNAFTTIFPGKYTDYNVFSAVKTKARKNINSVVIDSRWFRDHDSQFDERIIFWAKSLLSDPVAHTGKSIWRKLTKLCKEASLAPPSYSWVKKFVRDNERNHEIHAARFGKSSAFNNIEPYAKIVVDYAGSQWQIDGWNLPFYSEGWNRYVLFAVRDAYSRKIVGYSIDKSENTQMILRGLEDAVKQTGFLPYEIVSDNHSFNKTDEADYFKRAIKSLGIVWNVSHNPRRKAVAERYFRHLGELYCKDYPGYTGQGIKTKEKTGRPSQEYLDQFTKSGTWVTEAEIKMIAAKVVEQFNNDPLEKLQGKTPNQAHEESEKKHSIPIDIFTRLRLFTKERRIKVIRGQLNLTSAGKIYQYQLDANQIDKLNGAEVTARYEDFSTLYLYDEKERPLGSVKQKVAIHGAIAEQTPEDIKLLHQNKGRLNGVKSKAKKANEATRDKVVNISPDAFEAINPMTASKDILKEAEQSYLLKQRAQELGVSIHLAEAGLKPKSLIPESLQEKEKKIRSPFSVRGGQHKVDVIDLKKEEDY